MSLIRKHGGPTGRTPSSASQHLSKSACGLGRHTVPAKSNLAQHLTNVDLVPKHIAMLACRESGAEFLSILNPDTKLGLKMFPAQAAYS